MIPKIKKKLSSFLLSEEGKISKQSLLSLGSFISSAVIGGMLATKETAAAHTNNLSVVYNEATDTATGSHSHHSSHSSHGSHSSHSSHSSHGSHGSHGSHSSHGSHGSHGSHSSHSSHASHGSHGSHGSHSSHGSHGSACGDDADCTSGCDCACGPHGCA